MVASTAQMETTILESLAWTNAAFSNSGIAVTFRLVHVGPVRSSRVMT